MTDLFIAIGVWLTLAVSLTMPFARASGRTGNATSTRCRPRDYPPYED